MSATLSPSAPLPRALHSTNFTLNDRSENSKSFPFFPKTTGAELFGPPSRDVGRAERLTRIAVLGGRMCVCVCVCVCVRERERERERAYISFSSCLEMALEFLANVWSCLLHATRMAIFLLWTKGSERRSKIKPATSPTSLSKLTLSTTKITAL